MKAISGDVIEQLKARGIEVDTYVNDEVVKALLDAEFTHDYILKSIDDGDIKLKKQCEKSDDTEKDEKIEDKEVDEEEEKIEDKEDKEGEDVEVEKGGDIEISETVKEKLRQRKGKKAEKDAEVDRMQKAMYNDFMKSQERMCKSLMDEIASLRNEVNAMKGERTPFRGINSGAFLEKSFGSAPRKDDNGREVLDCHAHSEKIKSVLTKAFEDEKNDEVKKSLANDVMSYTISRSLTDSAISTLNKAGYVVEG